MNDFSNNTYRLGRHLIIIWVIISIQAGCWEDDEYSQGDADNPNKPITNNFGVIINNASQDIHESGFPLEYPSLIYHMEEFRDYTLQGKNYQDDDYVWCDKILDGLDFEINEDSTKYAIKSDDLDREFYVHDSIIGSDRYFPNLKEFLEFLRSNNYNANDNTKYGHLLITGVYKPSIFKNETYENLIYNLDLKFGYTWPHELNNCTYTQTRPVGVIFAEAIGHFYILLQNHIDERLPGNDIDWVERFSEFRLFHRVVAHEMGHQLGIPGHHSDYSSFDDVQCAMNSKFLNLNVISQSEAEDYFEWIVFPICICDDCAEHLCKISTYQYTY